MVKATCVVYISSLLHLLGSECRDCYRTSIASASRIRPRKYGDAVFFVCAKQPQQHDIYKGENGIDSKVLQIDLDFGFCGGDGGCEVEAG